MPTVELTIVPCGVHVRPASLERAAWRVYVCAMRRSFRASCVVAVGRKDGTPAEVEEVAVTKLYAGARVPEDGAAEREVAWLAPGKDGRGVDRHA